MAEKLRNVHNVQARRGVSSRRGRILWVTAAVLFFLLVAFTLWVWVRTRAGEGYGAGRYHHTLEETLSDAATAEADRPAALIASESEEKPNDEIVYHSRKNDRMEIALSFDDGPHPRLTPVILDILEK